MKKNAIKETLLNIADLRDDEWLFFSNSLEEKEYSKGAFLTSEGEKEHYLYFINKGIIRAYYCKSGREHCLDFCFQGEFITSFTSFITHEKSRINLEALSPVSVYRIARKKILESYDRFKNCERIGRKIAELLYIRKTNRELEFLSLSAKDRYLSLLERNPRAVGEIPVKHIASYLGIKAESLSRIRREIS